MSLQLAPWVLGVIVVYAVSLTWIFGYLLLGDIQRRRLKRRPDTIMAVADAALAEQPHLADDGEAVARTVLALEEVAELRRLARADGEAAAFVTPGCPNADAFLAVLFPRSKDAPKERP